MRIAHISDIHIRNLKYHADYRRVFDNLYEKLRELKPDLIVNTGDTAHTKTQISPEFVEMASTHFRKLAAIAPLHIILGNHDLNLMNADRQDAITPIVDSIGHPDIFLHKKSGRVSLNDMMPYEKTNFWVFGIGDQENYPTAEDWQKFPEWTNIGLFHGSVLNCITDSNWRMTHTEQELNLFSGLDYVLMGDIHKQQFMDVERRIGYAGSLIQQNFGEDVDKGFLVWDIHGKHAHDVFSVYLKGSRPFVTIDLNLDKTLPKIDVPEDARIRIRPKGPLTLVEQKAIERQVKKKYNPHDVITLSVVNVGQSRSTIGKDSVAHDNLRLLEVQERLLRRFLSEKGLSEKVLSKIMDLNKRIQIEMEQADDQARNVFWKVRCIYWNNLFNYGEGNHIDFSSISGLTGIFAPNASGKSNMIDVIMQTLFDSTTKGIAKNVFLINDNKDQATALVELEAENKQYILERTIERVKYGQRSGPTKEWGKTQVNFYGVEDVTGIKETLNGVSRPETERAVRKRVGSFDDFMLSNLFAQWNPSDIIQCKETERKRILYKFLDLDMFEIKGNIAKMEAKELYDDLRDLEDAGIPEEIAKHSDRVSSISEEIRVVELALEEKRGKIREIEDKIVKLSSQKIKVDSSVDPVDARKRLAAALKEYSDLEEERENLEKLIEHNRELEFKLPVIDESEEELKKKSDEYIIAKDRLEKIGRDQAKLSAQLSSERKKLPLLDEVPCGDTFPECKFLVDAFASKDGIPSLERSWMELKQDAANLACDVTELAFLSEKYRELVRTNSRRKEILGSIANDKLRLENLHLKLDAAMNNKLRAQEDLGRFAQAEQDVRENERLDEMILGLKTEKLKLTKAEAREQENLKSLHGTLGGQTTMLEKLTSELSRLEELRDICTAYEHFISAMGKDGIALDILKQKLPLVNEEINKILSSCADFNVHVEWNEEEETFRIFLQYGEYRQRLIELGSGAEKFLSSIALRNALLNISNLPKTNLFIIDEGFGKLDPKNMENVNRMFDYLRTVFDHIIVISHSDVMKDFVDNMIDITTDDEGYAHVQVG
jgi:DNA repair exonuclease SbcCD ATPase subunit/DNA repair exonuclease SbcCD nuclease subunit